MNEIRVLVPIVPDVVDNSVSLLTGEPQEQTPKISGLACWYFTIPSNYPAAGLYSTETTNVDGRDPDARPFVRQVSAESGGKCREEAAAALNFAELYPLETSEVRTPCQHRGRKGAWLDAVIVRRHKTKVAEWDGPSTTLGLALGLIMIGSDCGIPLIVATGDLESMKSPDKRAVIEDIAVTPIQGLGCKLKLVEEWARKNIDPNRRIDQKTLFFLPLQSWVEEPVEDEEPDELDREEFERRIRAGDNSWHARMEAVGVELVGVKTFLEAAGKLNARRLKPNAADWWTNAARGALVVAGAAVLLWGTVAWRDRVWRERPIDGGLAFAPVIDTAGQPHATPFRTSSNRPDTARPLCENGGLVAGQWMNVRLRTGDGSTPAETFWPVVVALPRTAGHRLNVYAAEDPKDGCDAGPVASGAVWACNFETDPTEFSDLLLMAFADRERNIATDIEQEVDKVKTRFATTGADGTPEVNLRSVINHFTALYPGRLITTMTRTVKLSKDCPL